MDAKKLFIIDLMPFLYKGHFVFFKNPRITSTGINTSALIGFANGLQSILKTQKPTHVVLAMDPSGPTFRHEMYPEYKAQREKMPEDLAACIPRAFELAEALRIPVIRKDGYEADDIMGSLANMASKEGFEVFVATPDKDAAQLVTSKIKLFRPGSGKNEPEIYDEEKVKEHWMLSSPVQMIDWLAMAGDTSDNIPGIKGVGEKTASALLSTWGSLENILEHASEIKGKLSEKIIAGSEDARISKVLATIKTDIPIEVDFDDFKRKDPDQSKLQEVCGKYELVNFAKHFLDSNSVNVAIEEAQSYKTIADTPHSYELVKTDEEAKKVAAILEASPCFAFDTETTGTNARECKLVGMSFSIEEGKAWYVAVPPYDEKRDDFGDLFSHATESDETLPFRRVAIFANAFADPSKTLVAQNGKFDITVLKRYGIVFGSVVRDTMLAHYVVDAAARHGMDAMSREFLGYDPIPITKLIGEKTREGQKNMADLSPEEICDYAAEDADVTLRLHKVLRKMASESGTLQALEDSEEPLVEVLIDMEKEGVAINVSALKSFGIKLEQEIISLVADIRKYGDNDLNIDSPKQLGELLFNTLGISGGKKTATGQFATDEKTLQKIVDEHPIVKKILEYRTCTKLKSTYVDKLPQCISLQDGRVHTTFSQALTETGRLSSSDPNLQNIPIRTERGKNIRAAIVARDENHRLISADYSQIELRIMAALSGDETMIEAFRNGEDIHTETAARVYDVMPGLVTQEMRSNCKMVNFGIIYGISAFGLSQRLNISRKEAVNLIESYFKLYPKVKSFMDASIAKAREKGYATTILGRRRTLRDINSRNATSRQAAERDAINTPVQGTAADLIKIAMVRVYKALKQANLKTKMILQIHDELLFDAPVDEIEQVKEIVKREMETAMDFGVPLVVELGVGNNWLEAH